MAPSNSTRTQNGLDPKIMTRVSNFLEIPLVLMYILLLVCFCQLALAHWYNPVADPRAIVINGKARFTILTPSLIRMEWSPTSNFEDHSTLAILNRRTSRLPLFHVEKARCANGINIENHFFLLQYCPEFDSATGFTAKSLTIQSQTGSFNTWVPGLYDDKNLHGTIRTLEGKYSAGAHQLNCSLNDVPFDFCTEGLISRNGWAVVDDSTTPLLDGSDWDWALPRPNRGQTDWYFFGYGNRFKEAMSDFTELSGKIPLPPRQNFGIYWSRYWAYSDQGEREIVQEYENHNTPLDVMVIDMDWHETFYKEAEEGKVDQAGERIGWTGYTWDKGLFPDPQDFLEWVKSKGIKTTLNLHPASGVQPHEQRYPEMARAMGIDPKTNKYVPFAIEDKKYATNLFDIMLDPLTQQGVDFWWLDWQQHENTTIANLNPTFWLNHVFFTRFQQTQVARPVILHRWGGLGNHRYQLGFSGDVTPTWEALNFQPYFTATAANVGFLWSHDIGGHTKPSPPEIYTRWVQFGIWSPVFRTHCTKSPDNDRRIWTYPLENFQIMRDAITLRSRMVPYIYTAARVSHDSGLGFVYPLYYSYPNATEAYDKKFQNQYMFGDSIMVAPITAPVDKSTGATSAVIWIPSGTWIELKSLEVFTGPQIITRGYMLSEMPVFYKDGSIIPMLPASKPLLGSAGQLYSTIHYEIYTSGNPISTTSELYEDDGNNDDYLNGAYTWSHSSLNVFNGGISFSIEPIFDRFPGMLLKRAYEIELKGVLPSSLKILVNGVISPFVGNNASKGTEGWNFNPNLLSATLYLLPRDIRSTINITILKDPTSVAGVPRCFERLKAVVNELDSNFPVIFQEDYRAVLLANEIQSSVNTLGSLGMLPSLITEAQNQIMLLTKLPLDTRHKLIQALAQCK